MSKRIRLIRNVEKAGVLERRRCSRLHRKDKKMDKVGQIFDKVSHRVETHYVGVRSKLKSEKRYQRLSTKDRVGDENKKCSSWEQVIF